MARPATLTAALVRRGFADPDRAAARLSAGFLAPLAAAPDVIAAFDGAAVPDLALGALDRLLDAAADREALVDRLLSDGAFRARLIAVLGGSEALGDALVRNPVWWHDLAELPLPAPLVPAEDLRADLLAAVGADPTAAVPVARLGEGPGGDAIRRAYRRRLLLLATRDLGDDTPVSIVAAELADLAAAVLEAALAVARCDVPGHGLDVALGVIGMGKCGGRELNYSSDVDVIFIGEPAPGSGLAEGEALRVATDLASRLMRICGAQTGEGTIWPVDANLRPEGRNGPLVRTVASHELYYRKWARTWEFQALLKARPVAGDADLCARYLAAVAPMVWTAAERPDFVADVQQMRARVERSIPRKELARQIKLGPGGLRDVEFAVQLLQLVHGRSDEALRSRSTLGALQALIGGGYVGRSDGGALDAAYRFLRTLEHRVQLERLQRTHLFPDRPAAQRRLGRAMGLQSDPVAGLNEAWKRQRAEVRRLHEKIFYRPLLSAVARIPGDDLRLTPAAARDRLRALGYADPAGALRHIQALTSGVSRRAAIQRTLLPVMLNWLAPAPHPDTGLRAFRELSDKLGDTHWYLGLLRDESATAERLATVLGASPLAAQLLINAPDGVTMLRDADDLRPRPGSLIKEETAALVARKSGIDPTAAADRVRAVRRRELFRIAAADVLGRVGHGPALSVPDVGAALSDVADATVTAALDVAVRTVAEQWDGSLPTRFAVIAMGRLGGREVNYASDADVMFVHDPLPGTVETDATRAALAVAELLRALLARPSVEPPLLVDADLRPEGRSGPLVRTLASYAAYYRRWSETWERQALLRARPLAGDPALLADFVALIDPIRYDEAGLSDTAIRSIRRIKARMEAERLPRGADPRTHLKLGRGGLSDVEWSVQVLQLQHAGTHPTLRDPNTLAALDAAAAADLVPAAEAEALADAWRAAAGLRDAITLATGRSSDQIPTARDVGLDVAYVCGYGGAGAVGADGLGPASSLVEDYLRRTRRSRKITERIVFGR